MIAAIKDAFKANLQDLKWMDPQTKAAALDKVSPRDRHKARHSIHILHIQHTDLKWVI